MNASAKRLAERGVGSVFLYTHEAHPGENYPEHRTMADKVRAAQALRDHYGVNRSIYLDDITGELHRAYGGRANMTWVFNKAGIPLYRSEWTDAPSCENAVEYYLDVQERRRNRERLAPFKVERIDYRDVNKEKRLEGLAKAGPKAVDDWVKLYEQDKLFFKPADDPGA